jgi:uncharacterized membrane protein
MKGRVIRNLMLGCCLLGAILSTASLYSHYSMSATQYCDLNATFNCDLVNRSIFSEFLGVPVALIGLLGYIFLFFLSVQGARWAAVLRFGTAIIGLGFALYLAYIEAYVLAAWCLLCIGSLAMISAIAVFAGIALWQMFRMELQVNAAK